MTTIRSERIVDAPGQCPRCRSLDVIHFINEKLGRAGKNLDFLKQKNSFLGFNLQNAGHSYDPQAKIRPLQQIAIHTCQLLEYHLF